MSEERELNTYNAEIGTEIPCVACGHPFVKQTSPSNTGNARGWHRFIDIPNIGPCCTCGLCEPCEIMAALRA